MADRKQTIDLMEAAFASMEELCSGLQPDDWDKPTDCPGWSVKDQLSHQNGLESTLLGRPGPRGNQAQVQARRPLAPEELLEEFREVTSGRLEALRAMSDEEFNSQGFASARRGGQGEFMNIRIFDCYMHEQDIRCAVGRPGNLDSPLAEFALGRCVMTLPMVVGKRVAPADGTTVVFEVTGAVGEVIPIVMQGGRAVRLDTAPSDPTAKLTLDVHAMLRLGGGRQTAERLEGHVRVDGDAELAQRTMACMTFTP